MYYTDHFMKTGGMLCWVLSEFCHSSNTPKNEELLITPHYLDREFLKAFSDSQYLIWGQVVKGSLKRWGKSLSGYDCFHQNGRSPASGTIYCYIFGLYL